MGGLIGFHAEQIENALEVFVAEKADVERARDRESGGSEQLAENQRHQAALAGRQGLEIVPPEVIGNEVIELVLALVRIKRLDHGVTFRERHVLRDLAAQGAVAENRG